jgi:hypothetical protein
MSAPISGTAATIAAAAAAATAAPSAPPSSTPALTEPPATMAVPAAALDTLTSAIYDLQRQMGQFAACLSDVESRPSDRAGAPSTQLHGAFAPSPRTLGNTGLPASAPNGASYSHPAPNSFSLGMPDLNGIPPSTSVIVHTSVSSRSVPITEIPFPRSPSAIPQLPTHPPQNHLPGTHAADHDDGLGVPRYHKLSFPSFDGKEDPLGWLNRCDHFFRAQCTREADKV